MLLCTMFWCINQEKQLYDTTVCYWKLSSMKALKSSWDRKEVSFDTKHAWISGYKIELIPIQMSLGNLSLCEEVKSLTLSIPLPSFLCGGGMWAPILWSTMAIVLMRWYQLCLPACYLQKKIKPIFLLRWGRWSPHLSPG